MHTLKNIQTVFESAGLTELFQEIQHYAKNSITIHVDNDAENQKLGTSRFGGDPDLPPEIAWFSNPESGAPLSFVTQLNFAELTALDTDKKLPSTGIMYFFYDLEAFLWGFDEKDSIGSRVYFHERPLQKDKKAA